jgi:hypothetical protein
LQRNGGMKCKGEELLRDEKELKRVREIEFRAGMTTSEILCSKANNHSLQRGLYFRNTKISFRDFK